MNYEDMLNTALENMPEVVHERERFEIPKIRGRLEGNKTVLTNLNEIADILSRPIDHIFKFLLKELAAPGKLEGNQGILGTKIPSEKINDKIKKYAEETVICKECGKPETELNEENGIVYLKCNACAAKYAVKTRL
ncbi:translation initiation factor IF-2 subunit beta [Candidatus Woesearchaeota archaeon]|nr:translation initiation factor IF-2 subunit beta [Candidatus Woesearchaeota archaeon]